MYKSKKCPTGPNQPQISDYVSYKEPTAGLYSKDFNSSMSGSMNDFFPLQEMQRIS